MDHLHKAFYYGWIRSRNNVNSMTRRIYNDYRWTAEKENFAVGWYLCQFFAMLHGFDDNMVAYVCFRPDEWGCNEWWRG
jgi:hypothetical protein